jgi:hypothetical protein
MSYTYEQLHAMNVADLRKIAEGIQHEAVHGFSTMHKEKLIPAICHALGISDHMHHTVVGVNKGAIKAEIRKLKKVRDAATVALDAAAAQSARHRIHDLKKKLRKATR